MVLSDKKRFLQKGFTLPIVLVFVLAFLAIPLLFWLNGNKNSQQPSVQGAETSKKEGTYVQVISTGSWDLFDYLCKSKEECNSSLDAGKKWEGISGGATDGSSVKINYSDLWKDYSYIKLFVKPGWGSSSHSFSLGTQDLESKSLEDTDVVILPTSTVESGNYTFMVFTDHP